MPDLPPASADAAANAPAPAPASAGAHASAPASSPAAPPPPSFLHQVGDLLAEIPLLFSDRVNLLALELRRAGLALAQMVGLVVAAAVLLATAWLGLWAGIAAGLSKAGLGLGWIVLVVVGLNLAGAVWAGMRIQRLAPLLTLPATLRHLTLRPSPTHVAGLSTPRSDEQARREAEALAAARAAADAVTTAARQAAAQAPSPVPSSPVASKEPHA